MATQLSLYNGALRLIGERKLASLGEDRRPRHVLDDVWADGFVDGILEKAQWNFAMRAVKIDASTTTIPAFGHTNAFDKPTDWLRTAGVCEDEFFNVPLLNYLEEVGFWFAEIDPIYVRYVSNAASYGNDLNRWPEVFTQYAEAYLASRVILTLSQDTDKQKTIFALEKIWLTEAKSHDAMSEATAFFPEGNWNSARLGRRSRLDRGKRNKLIG